MPQTRKRKQAQEAEHKPKPTNKSAKPANGLKETAKDPYPNHPRPTREECLAVRDDLLAFHGFPEEFAEYRKQRLNARDADGTAEESPPDHRKESVLDGLVRTLLSQNTTEVNSQKAFASLKIAFPTWEDVLAADSMCVENAIRCGGLARTKASCIKNLLSLLLERKEKLCLEYLRDLSVDEIKAELSHFKGIGPKTVFEIAKSIGWVPVQADRNKTYLHLNQWIPNELKFDLNCLLFTHGKLCRKCIKKGGNQQGKEPMTKKKQGKEPHDISCPLLTYCK